MEEGGFQGWEGCRGRGRTPEITETRRERQIERESGMGEEAKGQWKPVGERNRERVLWGRGDSGVCEAVDLWGGRGGQG